MARFICPKCKCEVDADATACPNCGVRFARSANESTQATPPAQPATPPEQPATPPEQQPEAQKTEETNEKPKVNRNNNGFSDEELEKYRRQDNPLADKKEEKQEKEPEKPSLTLQNQANTKPENTAEKSKKPLIIGLCVVAAIILIVVICMVSSCNSIRSEDANSSNTSGTSTNSSASSNSNSSAAANDSKPAETQKTVVYTTMPEEWKGETMYAYLYISIEGDNPKENAAFPGIEMTKGDDGKFSYEIPDGFENALVIFSTGNGVGEQFPYYNTDGYKIENGKTYSFEEYKKEYEAANPKE